MLRTPELKPYIINIKAPPFERLKETRHRAYARSTFDETSSRSFTVSWSFKPDFPMKILKGFRLNLIFRSTDVLVQSRSYWLWHYINLASSHTILKSLSKYTSNMSYVPTLKYSSHYLSSQHLLFLSIRNCEKEVPTASL